MGYYKRYKKLRGNISRMTKIETIEERLKTCDMMIADGGSILWMMEANLLIDRLDKLSKEPSNK